MPIYEYLCPECGHPFEKRVSFAAADAVQPCPECGSQRTRKQVSLFASHSAGGGVTASTGACGPVG